MNIYRILDGLLIATILLTPAQTTTTDKTHKVEVVKVEKEKKEEKEKKATRDSIIKATDKDLDLTIEVLSKKIEPTKEELEQVKETKRRLLHNYVNEVNKLVKEQGRAEKIVLRTDLKQQLKEGEIFLVKDSTCITYKRNGIFRKKRCVDWSYAWYLVDKKGVKEKLW